ncbi:MAG: hypothetical protein ABSC94_01060 [Polyangiaceae bacterium]
MRVGGLVCGAAPIALFALLASACNTIEPTSSTYFDRIIVPTIQTSCVRTNTGAGCHVADGKGNAFGNLDLTSYEGVNRRRDLLLDYGPYLQPSLLVKNIPPFQVTVELWDGTTTAITTDIKHAGGPIFDPTSSDYQTIRLWIENGATVNDTGVVPTSIPRTPCTHVVPSTPGFDPTTDPATSDYAAFEQTANPVLQVSCAAGNCHGTQVNALYLTCGGTPEEVRWNYFAAGDYVAATAEASEILRRPLATSQGGSYHEGGALFSSVTDPGYSALKTWAAAHGQATLANPDPAFMFFAQKVQPMLVKKGCMMAQCHSAAMFHEYRLRGGSAGSFSLHTTQRNYEFSVAQMSFESDDVNASRLVRKNLYRPDIAAGSDGLAHRGGPLFEDFGTSLAAGELCDAANYDFDNAPVDGIPAYCVVREWHRRERTERNLAPISAVVYVSRPIPSGSDRAQDFDVFEGGASLHIVPVTSSALGTGGGLTLGMDMTVDLTSCGLGASVDLRRPAVSWDGQTIAFGARSSDADPLAVYTMNADGTGCTKQPDIAMHDATGNGRLEHDFDPAFSPPGPDGIERIVFASTRGNLDSSQFDYSGPQGTPSDPTKPNANLYVLEPTPGGAGSLQVRQLTWQLDMERMPSFMSDGRLIFTTEKREPNFYQLALRRQNLDGGDYHPLYAQRASIGYPQATYGVELADKDFVAVFSDSTAQHGAGAVVVFNRSIGLDFTSTNAGDYLVDPTVIDPTSASAPEADFFLHSFNAVANDGSYTSPSRLPDDKMLVSFGAGDPSTFGGDYDVYLMDPVTGRKTQLLGNAGTAEVDAVAVYARTPNGIFASVPDEPNGHTVVDVAQTGQPPPANAEVTVLDMPVLASLLFQNTPTGRVVESDMKAFDVYEDVPPDVTAFPACGGFTVCDDLGPTGMVYVRRRLVGTVPVQADGSAHFLIPGGLPLVLNLPVDAESKQSSLPRWQREEMTFVPGEHTHQAFPAVFFNNLCAGCHGSISGRPVDAALSPDFLTEASTVVNVASVPADLTGMRQAPVQPASTSP